MLTYSKYSHFLTNRKNVPQCVDHSQAAQEEANVGGVEGEAVDDLVRPEATEPAHHHLVQLDPDNPGDQVEPRQDGTA